MENSPDLYAASVMRHALTPNNMSTNGNNLDGSEELTLSECIEIDLCGLRAVMSAVSGQPSDLPEVVNAIAQLEALLDDIRCERISNEEAESKYERINADIGPFTPN